MTPDRAAKRTFIGVVLALGALSAYLQAKGAAQLLGAGVLPGEELLTELGKPPRVAAPLVEDEPPTAEPILARNPFDSVTGPLNAEPLKPLPEANPVLDAAVDDPLHAPVCEKLRLEIVTESPDPEWSLAAIQAPGEPRAVLRRVGDPVADKEVVYIGYNREEQSPAVWLASSTALCQTLLFEQPAAPKPAAKKPPPKKPGKKPAAKKPRRAPKTLPKEMADKIQKVSATSYAVDRAVVDKIMENQAELMRSARIVPESKDGRVVGIRMFGIRPKTLLNHLGFQNGDRLESINGFDMTSPEKALEAYARLRTAKRLTVKVNRRGKPLSIDYDVK